MTTKKLTLLGLFLGLIFILSIFENTLPPLPLMPPGFKLGLSNIIIMYSLFFIGKKEAILLNILKSCFVFTTRGVTAGILSFCGGICSVLILILLITVFKEKISYLILSVFGAITHNLGQLAATYFILDNYYLIYYLPILIMAGLITGIITGIILKFVMPALKNITEVKQ